MTSNAIEIDGLSVSFPGFTLGPLSLRLQAGERVALLGPNGAGKSTTMRALAGRLRGYAGQVRLAGTEVGEGIPAVRARIGFLPEKLLGFRWMTVAEHLTFLSAFYPTWDDHYAHQLLERVALSPDARIGTLSKGMEVKLSLVAAEAHRPAVLLLDEPTSGIDPVMRGEILALIDEVAPRKGERVVVFSSHLLEDVDRIAERVLLLREGRLVGDHPVEALKGDPGRSLAAVLYDLLAGSSTGASRLVPPHPSPPSGRGATGVRP